MSASVCLFPFLACLHALVLPADVACTWTVEVHLSWDLGHNSRKEGGRAGLESQWFLKHLQNEVPRTLLLGRSLNCFSEWCVLHLRSAGFAQVGVGPEVLQQGKL